MIKLISKNEEAEGIALVWNMAVSSLSPDSFDNLEQALKELCLNRHINNEVLAVYQIKFSGKTTHAADCATSQSPAYIPGPCDCEM